MSVMILALSSSRNTENVQNRDAKNRDAQNRNAQESEKQRTEVSENRTDEEMEKSQHWMKANLAVISILIISGGGFFSTLDE